jgi:hypothetical protein
LNEKTIIAPREYVSVINKHFTCELEDADRSYLIFNSNIKMKWVFKKDEKVVIECNPVKAYLISLILNADDTIDVEAYSKLTMKKLTSNKELSLSKELVIGLNKKFVKDDRVDDI